MANSSDRREAAEILRRIVATLPDPTSVQVAFLLGQATFSTQWRTDAAEVATPGQVAAASPAARKSRQPGTSIDCADDQVAGDRDIRTRR
jgi:cytochrome c-type biogenesis protein CcmH/NrfG